MPENRGKISLEELIQLKRSERPDSEFWEKFDRELVLKQRLLSQKQPVGKAVFIPAFWTSTKKILAYSGATASTAAFLFVGYIGLNTMQTASVETAPPVEATTPTFSVAVSVDENQTNQQNTLQKQTVSFENDVQLAANSAVRTPAATAQPVSNNTSLNLAEFNAEAYALTRPLEGLDIEQIVNLRERVANSSPVGSDLRDKYLEPVGYFARANSLGNQSISNVHAARLESRMYTSNSRQSSRFSEITLLRF